MTSVFVSVEIDRMYGYKLLDKNCSQNKVLLIIVMHLLDFWHIHFIPYQGTHYRLCLCTVHEQRRPWGT